MNLEITIGKRNGTPTTIQADWNDFPANAQEKIIRYGFQRVFNDAVGGSDTTTEAKVAEVREMMERFKRGEVGRVARESVDPVQKEARVILYAKFRTAGGANYAKLKGMEQDERNAKLDEILVKNPDVMKLAAAEVKRKAALAEKAGEIDLGGMTL